MLIYKATNLVNGKIYIGKHEKPTLGRYKGSGTLFKRALKKYGKANFCWTIIEDQISTKKELDAQEAFYIAKFNATDMQIGYNIARGGEGGDTLSHHPNREEIIAKQQQTIKSTMFAKHGVTSVFSLPSVRDKCQATKITNRTLIDHKHIDADRARCRNLQPTRPIEQRRKTQASNEHGRGIKLSEEKQLICPQRGHALPQTSAIAFKKSREAPKSAKHCENLSISLTKFWVDHSPTNSVQVVVDGVLYPSFMEASRITGLNMSTLRNRCKSKNPHFINTYRMDAIK